VGDGTRDTYERAVDDGARDMYERAVDGTRDTCPDDGVWRRYEEEALSESFGSLVLYRWLVGWAS
jgi:hypothetical protein